jgi:hypothetical protein
VSEKEVGTTAATKPKTMAAHVEVVNPTVYQADKYVEPRVATVFIRAVDSETNQPIENVRVSWQTNLGFIDRAHHIDNHRQQRNSEMHFLLIRQRESPDKGEAGEGGDICLLRRRQRSKSSKQPQSW